MPSDPTEGADEMVPFDERDFDRAKDYFERRPTPMALYDQAAAEFPNEPTKRGQRYIELMREAGHIVKREPGDDSPLLPCGWDPREGRHGASR